MVLFFINLLKIKIVWHRTTQKISLILDSYQSRVFSVFSLMEKHFRYTGKIVLTFALDKKGEWLCMASYRSTDNPTSVVVFSIYWNCGDSGFLPENWDSMPSVDLPRKVLFSIYDEYHCLIRLAFVDFSKRIIGYGTKGKSSASEGHSLMFILA